MATRFLTPLRETFCTPGRTARAWSCFRSTPARVGLAQRVHRTGDRSDLHLHWPQFHHPWTVHFRHGVVSGTLGTRHCFLLSPPTANLVVAVLAGVARRAAGGPTTGARGRFRGTATRIGPAQRTHEPAERRCLRPHQGHLPTAGPHSTDEIGIQGINRQEQGSLLDGLRVIAWIVSAHQASTFTIEHADNGVGRGDHRPNLRRRRESRSAHRV